MRAWLPLLVLSVAFLVFPTQSKAVSKFAIGQMYPTNGASGVPVDLGGDAYHQLSGIGYATHAINLALTGLPGGCSLIRSTFNQQTVRIFSSKESYTLGTVSANLDASRPWIALGSAVSGFELSPFTEYTLSLLGGANGILLSCNGQTLTLDSNLNYSFTTGADTVPPQILGPQVRATNTTATITWETFQLASGQIAYGLSNFDQTANQLGSSTLHSVILTGLKAGSDYTYQIRSTDAAGNIGTSNGKFNTVGLGDVVVSDLQDMSATIHWTTNQPTDSIIEFGPSLNYGDKQGNGGQITNHTLKLVGLKPATTYHFRIVATNENGTSTFGDNQFTTKGLPVGTHPSSNDGISTSSDNFKMFPQVNFQPMVLGASHAATAISDGFTIGKNLLAGRAVPPNNSTGRTLIILIWVVPLLLITGIAFVLWRLRQQKAQFQA